MHLSPEFFHSSLYTLVVLPLLIFFARICDVSIGTIRIIFVSRGMKRLAPLLGFFEVLIWLVAIGQVMQNLTNPIHYIAYGAGFAAGNYVGMYLEEKLAMGVLIIRIITNKDASELIQRLKQENYGVTSICATGAVGEVKMVFTVIKRKDLPKVIEMIQNFNPKAFVSVEDVRSVNEGVFPPSETNSSLRLYRTSKRK